MYNIMILTDSDFVNPCRIILSDELFVL